MAQWKKLLARIVTDRRPTSYTYEELASLLVNRLGFTLATPIDGSHRRFRRFVPVAGEEGKARTVTIGLLDYGSGPVAPEYVKEMVQTLRANDFLPEGVD